MFGNRFLHKSHLKIYKLCPKKFEVSYDDVVRKERKQYAVPLIEGTAFHEWAAYIIENNIRSIDQISDYIMEVDLYNMLDYFINENNNINSVLDYVEFYLENKAKMRGTIDRYYVNEDCEGILVEYKTGNSNTFSNTYIDFGFYSILLLDNGYNVDKWQLINPRKQQNIIKDIDYKKIEKVRDIISDIRNITEFQTAKCVGFWCYDCLYRTQCKTYNQKYNKIEDYKKAIKEMKNVEDLIK